MLVYQCLKEKLGGVIETRKTIHRKNPVVGKIPSPKLRKLLQGCSKPQAKYSGLNYSFGERLIFVDRNAFHKLRENTQRKIIKAAVEEGYEIYLTG